MPTVLDIEKQRFTFSDRWKAAFKYDDTSFYRNGPEKLKGGLEGHPQATRAVDVVGLHDKAGVLLLEAKDFRGHRIANKRRITDAEIVVEAALKARDTLAGLVGAARKGCNEFAAADIWSAMEKPHPLLIVLWLEDDASANLLYWKQQLDTLAQRLKEKIGWMEARCYVLSSKTQNRLPDLSVTNLPGAGQSS